jgi:hypothetical protein
MAPPHDPRHPACNARLTTEQLLNAWRDAERRLAATSPETVERVLAAREVERCRAAYQAFQAETRGLDDRSHRGQAELGSSAS